jgi:formylglycine-generating enzyme required for sulfatase activity
MAGASWVGALDLCGNVWEWCSSAYWTYPYDARDGRESMDEILRDSSGRLKSGAAKYRIVRGGTWYYDGDLRAAYRGEFPPDTASIYNGFRCARSA